MVSGAQIRAGRVLLGWTPRDLARMVTPGPAGGGGMRPPMAPSR
jgi:hypothetical protein